jgi:hypothetical protein
LAYSRQASKASAKIKVEAHRKAIRLINSLERNVGWPLTKSFRITENLNGGSPNRKLSDKDVLYMVVGNMKWLRSPVMISMYAMLLRSGTCVPFRF